MPTTGTRYHGLGGVAYLGATASPAAASRLWGLTEWALNQSQDIAEVTALGDTSKSFVAGLKSATLSIKGFAMSDFDVPFDAYDIANKVTAYLYMSKNNLGQFFWFNCWPTAVNISVSTAGPVTMDFTATLDGDVTRT